MQPPLPTIPTDNLYKFLAITGLVIVLICLIYPPMITAKVSGSAAEVAALRQLLESQTRQLDHDLKRIETEILQNQTEPVLPLGQAEALDDRVTKARAANVEMQARLLDFERKAKTALAEGRALQSQMDLMVNTLWLGILLMACGFFLWYTKVQRHADTIIRNQALQTELQQQARLGRPEQREDVADETG